jgi:hypothetical protein
MPKRNSIRGIISCSVTLLISIVLIRPHISSLHFLSQDKLLHVVIVAFANFWPILTYLHENSIQLIMEYNQLRLPVRTGNDTGRHESRVCIFDALLAFLTKQINTNSLSPK